MDLSEKCELIKEMIVIRKAVIDSVLGQEFCI